MMGRPLLFPVLVFFLISALYYTASAALGGWKPIKNVNDPTVVEIGKFAVDEHNEQAGSKLQFSRVVKGETQTVSGMNYKLTIAAKKGGIGGLENKYEALVWDKPWQKFRKLVSFKGPV